MIFGGLGTGSVETLRRNAKPLIQGAEIGVKGDSIREKSVCMLMPFTWALVDYCPARLRGLKRGVRKQMLSLRRGPSQYLVRVNAQRVCVEQVCALFQNLRLVLLCLGPADCKFT